MKEAICHGPSPALFGEGSSTSQASRTLDLAEGVNDAGRALFISPVRNGQAERIKHTEESPCRVDGQDEVVKYDKRLEEAGFADSPWLVISAGVDRIDICGGGGVNQSDGYGNVWVEKRIVPVCRDGHRMGEVGVVWRRW